MFELVVAVMCLVSEDNTQPLVEVTLDLQIARNQFSVKLGVLKDLGIGLEEDLGACAASHTHDLHTACDKTSRKTLLVELAVASYTGDELLAERVHHTGTHTVQTA